MKLVAFAQLGEYPVYHLCTRGPSDGGLYLSAGIHGDEPAGPEALVRWAETHLPTLARAEPRLPLFILPCLNPWGLVNNRRSDARGHDLNRAFHRRIAPVPQLKKLLAGRRFVLGVALHEDYDANGVYLYEIDDRPPGWGRRLLRACSSRAMPIETRRRIEDFPFKNGLLSRRIPLEDVTIYPEALCLYPQHARRFLTFETPSEFSLADRVQAHILLIEECVRRLQGRR